MDFARSYPSIAILYLHKYSVLLTSSKWNIVRQLKPKNSAEINTIIILNTTGLYWWWFSFQTRIQTETSTRTHQQHHSRIGGMAFRGHTSSSSIHPHGRHPPFHSHSFSTCDRELIPSSAERRSQPSSSRFIIIYQTKWAYTDIFVIHNASSSRRRIRIRARTYRPPLTHTIHNPASHQYYSTWLQASTIIKSFLDPPILHS